MTCVQPDGEAVSIMKYPCAMTIPNLWKINLTNEFISVNLPWTETYFKVLYPSPIAHNMTGNKIVHSKKVFLSHKLQYDYLIIHTLKRLPYNKQQIPIEINDLVVNNPAKSLQRYSNLNHILTAPPATTQVSGWVIHTSVWIPRSIHWPFVLSVLTAEFIFKINHD